MSRVAKVTMEGPLPLVNKDIPSDGHWITDADVVNLPACTLNTIPDCSWWPVAEFGDSCSDIAVANSISLPYLSSFYVSSSAP